MAKPTYKVWVVNMVSLGTRVNDRDGNGYYFDWDQKKLDQTAAELKSLFDEVCKNALSKFGDCTVDASKDINTVGTLIQPGEMIIRLTTRKSSALISKYGSGGLKSETSGATKDTGSGVLSEAWIEGCAGSATVPELLARLAFHELMHNKLDATVSSKDIHSKPDDGTGLATGTVAYNTDLTDTNKRNLAPKLGAIGAQFTGATIP